MPFVVIDKLDTPAAVRKYWNDFERTRTPIRKAPRMPVTKSVAEVAWAAVYALARQMVSEGKSPDVDSAVQTLRLQSHPVYATYLAASVPGAPTPTTPASDIGKVVKAAQSEQVRKRAAVQTAITKLAAPFIRDGLSVGDATIAVFARYPDVYQEYRKASYADGPLPAVQRQGSGVKPDGPALALAKRLAQEMRDGDAYGAHAGVSETAMVAKVWDAHPALFAQYREESYNRG